MRNTLITAALVCLMALINSTYSATADDAAENQTGSEAKLQQTPPSAGKKGQDKKTGRPAKGSENKSLQKKINVAQIAIRGSLTESAPEPGIFGELTRNLSETLRRLRRAATDDDITAVVLKLRNPAIGRGKLAELRESIDRLQAAGKKVYADVEMGTTADYLLAATCDEIVMPESGTLLLPGVRAEVLYYKGLLDKLGIQADMMQVGDFKGAAEPLTREKMSPEFRQQFETVIDDFYRQMVQSIAADRGLAVEQVEKLIDQGLFSAEQAQRAGLIDRVAYADDFQKHLKTQFKADELTVKKNYGRKELDTDFSGMMGFIKLFELISGASSSQRMSKIKKIAIVYGVGAITTGEGGASLLGDQIMGSDTIVRALKKAGDDETVVAIVFRIDSPGGSALASDLIWRQIQKVRAKKPVIASMGDTAASGGYYIAMGCDKIYAGPGTLTGSIGVVGGKLAMGGLFDKVGLSTEVIGRGKHSGMMSMDQPFSDSERTVWKQHMEEVYQRFTDKVAASRNLDRKQLASLAGGRVWTGRQAASNGLVDRVGTLYDALADAKQTAGIKPDEKVELWELPTPRSFFDQLFDTPVDESRAQLRTAVDQIAPGSAAALGEIETLRRLFAEPALMMLPYRVEIR